MGRARFLALLLLLSLPLSFAFIIESGDGGAAFVEEKSSEMCRESGVQAVYKCLGNVVRVVSSNPGEGSTFYKPEGKVVQCPVVPPSEMGAECLQMMGPNFCPVQAECGASPAPEIFPGQNDTPEQTGDADAYILPGQAASDNITNNPEPAVEPEPQPYVPKKKTTILKNNSLDADAAVKSSGDVDSPLGYLVYVILLLGIGAVGVLFMLFKNSIAEDEA